MGKFYCNKCEHDVVLKNGVCPICETNWGKEFDDETFYKYEDKDETGEQKGLNRVEIEELNKNEVDATNNKVSTWEELLQKYSINIEKGNSKNKLFSIINIIISSLVGILVGMMTLSSYNKEQVTFEQVLGCGFIAIIGFFITMGIIYFVNKDLNANNDEIQTITGIETNKVCRLIAKYNKMSIEQKIEYIYSIHLSAVWDRIFSNSIEFGNRFHQEVEDITKLSEILETNKLSIEEYAYLICEINRGIVIDKNGNAVNIWKSMQKYMIEQIQKEYECSIIKMIQIKLLSSSDTNLDSFVNFGRLGNVNVHLIANDNKIMIIPTKNIVSSKIFKFLLSNEKYTSDVSYDVEDSDDKEKIVKIISNTIERINDYKEGAYKVRYSIKIDDILFYSLQGEKTYNTIISGGGVSGRKIDSHLAAAYQSNKFPFQPTGDAGAVYSMLNNIEVEPITTEIKEIDDRIVIIKTKDNDYIFKRINNDSEDLYLWLLDVIPEKDYERVIATSNKNNNEGNKKLDVTEEIKKYKELLDMGAITQEEYDKKKNELLK